jgi:phosphatidylserine/phosphatidylglycerophosphate/cardiolipin synthase-like enzyme
VFTSRTYKLGESKALRIDTLANSANPNRLLYISSMNWNAPAVTHALINAHNKGVDIKVIVNGSALRGGNEQLAQLHNAGVPVYVFDPHGEKREAQHSKLLLRFDGDDTLVINSTANLTPQGNRELNLDEYNSDSQVAAYFKEAFDDYIAKHCVPYGEIELPASQPSQGTKRKLTFEDENKKPNKRPRTKQ